MPTNDENPSENKTLNYNRRPIVPKLPITPARILSRIAISLCVTGYALAALLLLLALLQPTTPHKKTTPSEMIIGLVLVSIYLVPVASIITAIIALRKSNRVEQPYIVELARPALFLSFFLLILTVCPLFLLCLRFPHQH